MQTVGVIDNAKQNKTWYVYRDTDDTYLVIERRSNGHLYFVRVVNIIGAESYLAGYFCCIGVNAIKIGSWKPIKKSELKDNFNIDLNRDF